MRALVLLSVLVLTACGTSTLEQKSYSKACGTAADCTAAFFGDLCASCSCPNGVVGAASLKKYEADAKSGKAWCGPQQGVVCGPCQQAVVDCVDAQCVLK